ncbi:MAG: hypothetical protein R3E12_06970 [Candidatus Eisenbacteria bacterium]
MESESKVTEPVAEEVRPQETQESDLAPRVFTLALGGVFLAGILLRLFPCFDAFWLDEVWSYFWAREITSPLGVFTQIHHSNNHHLPTLWMFLMGTGNTGSGTAFPR